MQYQVAMNLFLKKKILNKFPFDFRLFGLALCCTFTPIINLIITVSAFISFNFQLVFKKETMGCNTNNFIVLYVVIVACFDQQRI